MSTRSVVRGFAIVVFALAVLLAGAFFALVQPPRAGLQRASDDWPVGRESDLLADVLRAHGGSSRWQRLSALRVRLRFGGFAFRMRLAEPEPMARWLEIDLTEPRAEFSEYPFPNQRGVFTPDRVWIEDASGVVLRSLDDPREVLLDSRWRQIVWDDLDLLYFAGYAAWNYFQGPFLLTREGIETREIDPWEEQGESWRRLAVRFPDSIPTHSREQVFYFGPDLRERRHDYQPEVFASWADAAHYVESYREVDGLQLPANRRVLPRDADNRSSSEPVLVWIEVLDMEPIARSLPAR